MFSLFYLFHTHRNLIKIHYTPNIVEEDRVEIITNKLPRVQREREREGEREIVFWIDIYPPPPVCLFVLSLLTTYRRWDTLHQDQLMVALQNDVIPLYSFYTHPTTHWGKTKVVSNTTRITVFFKISVLTCCTFYTIKFLWSLLVPYSGFSLNFFKPDFGLMRKTE